jgi:hypothetical protein
VGMTLSFISDDHQIPINRTVSAAFHVHICFLSPGLTSGDTTPGVNFPAVRTPDTFPSPRRGGQYRFSGIFFGPSATVAAVLIVLRITC